MVIISAVSNNMGMLFNNRRLSRDKILSEYIIDMTKNSRLLVNEYSAELFNSTNLVVTNDFLEIANENDYCFVENIDLSPFFEKIDRIILFKWNREYPSDLNFCFPKGDWNCIESMDFKGNSHSKITKEVYEK